MQEEPSPHGASNLIAEASIDETTSLVFVDEGGGNVGVAEISTVGKASIIMDMFQREHASPLEIFLATAHEGEAAPDILVENHRDIALRQGREDLTPRRVALRQDEHELPGLAPAAAWYTNEITACTATGWEGPNGAWGNPVDSWDNIFAISTTPYVNNVSYPKEKLITQNNAWNGGGGSYHSHGACVSKDTGADKTIHFEVFRDGVLVFPPHDISAKVGENNYVIYNDYITGTSKTKSWITNDGNSSASFRHSAAAWVPNPQ